MIMENPEKTNNGKKKKFYIYSIAFACLILILSACNCPKIRYIGRYTLDVISRKDLYLRTIDDPNWAEKIEITGVAKASASIMEIGCPSHG